MNADLFEIQPAPAELTPFVRRFVYANQALAKPVSLQVKPNGYAFSSNFFARQARPTRITVDGVMSERGSRWMLAGQIEHQVIRVEELDHFGVVYMELAATAPYRLFGLNGPAQAGRAQPLPKTVQAVARDVFKADESATRETHLAEAARFIALMAAEAREDDPIVGPAVALLEKFNGAISVTDVCRELDVNQKQLARRFAQVVGLRPKIFAQMLQMSWVLGLLYMDDKASLTQIAHEAGFYDQAHFNHAMQQFFQQGPKAFLASEHVELKAFLAASRQVERT